MPDIPKVYAHDWAGPYDGGWHCYRCGRTVTMREGETPVVAGCEIAPRTFLAAVSAAPAGWSARALLRLAQELGEELQEIEGRLIWLVNSIGASARTNRGGARVDWSWEAIHKQVAAVTALWEAKMDADLEIAEAVGALRRAGVEVPESGEDWTIKDGIEALARRGGSHAGAGAPPAAGACGRPGRCGVKDPISHTVVIVTPPGKPSNGLCWGCDTYADAHPFRVAIWEDDQAVTLSQMCARCVMDKGWSAHYYRSAPKTEALL